MPAFGRLLSDAQVAAVVGFIRSNLGNAYPEPPSEADVAAAR
jgi:mono/diheme cytochrome c family protein